jgi:hypothetical protein
MKIVVVAGVVWFAMLLTLTASAKAPVQSGTIALDQASPALGDTVTFTWTATGLKPKQVPRIQIVCSQDGVVTYAAADSADAGFVLGAGSSAWKSTGGPADCVATLYYWDWKPYQRSVPLASLNFAAGG